MAKVTPEEGKNLRALLRNKGALTNMQPEDIATILDSVRKDYDERFSSDLESIPDEILGSIILKLQRRTRHKMLRDLPPQRILNAFEQLDDEHIALIMHDLEGVDEGKYKNIFDQLKNIEVTSGVSTPSARFEKDYQARELTNDTIIRLYYAIEDAIHIEEIDGVVDAIDTQGLVWIDLIRPTLQEIECIEKLLKIDIPTINEREEIEVSSRYWEEEGVTTINSYFVTHEEGTLISETVSLILKDSFLVSVRFRKLRSFDELMKKVVLVPKGFDSGAAVLTTLMDLRIDIDADMLEKIVKEISQLRKSFVSGNELSEDSLREISHCEDLNMKMRETLLDKSRIVNSLLKNRIFTPEQISDLRIMLKDVTSLIDHAEFNFQRLDSIQNIALSSIGIKQSKTMNIFTIANVLFLPPTLIASIYGMNFEFMPELKWVMGYPLSICLMLASSLLPYMVFKKKGWL